MEDIYQDHSGRFLKHPILTSKETLSDGVMREKSKKLAALEQEIINMVSKLPKEVKHILDLHIVGSDENKSSGLYFSMPLFYQQDIEISLRNSNKEKDWNISSFGVNSGIELNLEIFSDKDLSLIYVEFLESQPRKTSSYCRAETSYFFDIQGNIAKTIELPRIFMRKLLSKANTKLKPVYSEEIPVYQSTMTAEDFLYTMTAEDFLYAERALTVIKDRIEDYLKWSRQPQSSDVN